MSPGAARRRRRRALPRARRTAAAIAARRAGSSERPGQVHPRGGHHEGSRPAHVEPVRRARSSRSPSPTTRSARALAEAEVPPLLPALAYLTGDLSLLRDDLRPDPILLAHAPGRADRRAAGRRPASSRSRRSSGSATAAAAPRRRRRDADLLRIMEFAVGGGADMDDVPAAARGGARVPRRGPARARLAQGRRRARRRLPRR